MNVAVLDHTALLALGAGHRMLSGLVDTAHNAPDRHAFIPALCLAAAVAERVGLADHIGSLPTVEVLELGYPDACAAGRLIADGVDWGAAHAVAVGRPTVDWPGGRPVVTTMPQIYARHGVQTIALRT